MSYKIVDGGVLVLEDRLDDLSKPDAIIFDCDGTLIDTASSFQLIGKLIVTIYLNRFCGIECRLGDDFDEAFQLLKMLGGFNKRALAQGPEAIDAELERLRPAIEAGGYIPFTDHSEPPDISFANHCYYMQRLHEVCGG